MSFEATRWAWAQTLPPRDKLVLLDLADRADERAQAWPSQSAIAERTNLGERAIRDALARLRAASLISVEHQYRRGGGRTSSRYTLALGLEGQGARGQGCQKGQKGPKNARERSENGAGEHTGARAPVCSGPEGPEDEPRRLGPAGDLFDLGGCA